MRLVMDTRSALTSSSSPVKAVAAKVLAGGAGLLVGDAREGETESESDRDDARPAQRVNDGTRGQPSGVVSAELRSLLESKKRRIAELELDLAERDDNVRKLSADAKEEMQVLENRLKEQFGIKKILMNDTGKLKEQRTRLQESLNAEVEKGATAREQTTKMTIEVGQLKQ